MKSKKNWRINYEKTSFSSYGNAGMGSRYGGLKQIDPVDKEDTSLWIFPLFDAKKEPDLRRLFLL